MAQPQAMISQLSRESKKNWISQVRTEFKRGTLASNAIFGAILLGFEKFIEKEFACPCDPRMNAWFAVAYFTIPALVVFLLMIKTKGLQCKRDNDVKTLASSVVPALFWVIIVLWDGHSWACYQTTWSGNYVEIEKAAPFKWCKPANLTSSQEYDYKMKTQHWFFWSQVTGMVLVTLLILLYGVHFVYEKYFKQRDQATEDYELQINEGRYGNV